MADAGTSGLWRSAAVRPRLWVPLVAILVGIAVPAVVAFGLLGIAGVPGIDGGDALLRRAILLVLYTLMAAPVPGWFLLPLTWPILLALMWKGYAGPLSVVSVACLFGLCAAHFLLNGDLTSEAPEAVPCLIIAFGIQAAVVWRLVWALQGWMPARATAGDSAAVR